MLIVVLSLGIIAARIAAASAWAQKIGTPTSGTTPSSSSTSAVSEDSSSPGTPAEEYRPITTSLNLDYSSKVRKYEPNFVRTWSHCFC